ncbi:RHS repeat-associated core domain-containing protein, partial [Flavobacterium jejuense]
LKGGTPTVQSTYQYKYNGKELQTELGLNMYDYGARNYDPTLGRWMNMDPLAEKYIDFSPYNYVLNNPVKFVDPDGMQVDGDYYSATGEWIRNDGVTDDKAYVVIQPPYVDDNGNYADPVNVELSVKNSELLLLASTSYGESSLANNKTEMYAISNAIVNNQSARGNGVTIAETISGYAFAASDGNPRTAEFNSTSPSARNGTSMQDAIGGAINAVNGGHDYSNGATHWAGDDVLSSSEKRATGGLNVIDSSHDVHGVGSKKANGAPVTIYWEDKNRKKTAVRGTYNYTWETTAGYSGKHPKYNRQTGSTFMKKTNNFINATGAPRY